MRVIFFIVGLFVCLLGCKSQKDKLHIAPKDSMHVAAMASLSNLEKQKYQHAIENFLNHSLLRSDFNGSILVAKNGTIVYEKYVGYKDIKTKEGLTAETPLQIASTSKTFTAIAILKLIQEGKLQLNDSLGVFFPGFPYPGVTVKMLLSHRSGLPNYMYYLEPNHWDRKAFLTNGDVLNTLMTLRPPKAFNPNTRFQYCNTNYVLLALIIEKLSGVPFPVYMKTNIFEPLEMNNTFVCTMNDSLRITPSYNAGSGLWQLDYTDGPYGDKNVYSTPRDLLKWDQALYTNFLVNKALLDSAFTPYSNESPSQHNYGLGWRLLILPSGKKLVYHHGRWHGFNSAFARLIDEKATIIILGNKYKSSIYTTARKMYNLFGDYGESGVQVLEDNGGSEGKE
ncbi:beta-lactamase family protein [Chitinophagaceae bacterium LB-8]|uniref:Beta-lactamase family protein n=1 Tax=Paraflavisolibacter caeni TaxID=2982496 RepID=A0A9X2XNV1_9BACT|nr:serine hydrolase [Paraflavisolibacter caeni]MCU7549179.1 beta-lactamase family protein [Paraflavisolibacter caeni]